jgi:hypothetical protein
MGAFVQRIGLAVLVLGLADVVLALLSAAAGLLDWREAVPLFLYCTGALAFVAAFGTVFATPTFMSDMHPDRGGEGRVARWGDRVMASRGIRWTMIAAAMIGLGVLADALV